jgi:tetratricopeptide (TPR) repeat protein
MKTWTLAFAALCLTTAGCGTLDFGPRSRVAQQPDMSNYFTQRLEVGRAHLAGGRPTKAIEAFRQASYNSDCAPEAYNGMAVAYAALGRTEVARDLFVRAIDLDPADLRFRRNLAKVGDQIMLARQAATVSPAIAQTAAEPAPAASVIPASATGVAVAGPRIETSRPRAVRTAKVREVFIHTPPTPEEALRTRVAERKLDSALVRAPIMIGARRAQTARAPKPIRIEPASTPRLASVTGRKGSTPSGPARIFLEKP